MWALNPLGGQASLCVLFLENLITTGSASHITHHSSGSGSVPATAFDDVDMWDTVGRLTRTLCQAPLYDPDAGTPHFSGTPTNFSSLLTRLGGLEQLLRTSPNDL
ncbi:hypothetical protein BJ546DRAFT_180382 [Cryomyces antarcticus]